MGLTEIVNPEFREWLILIALFIASFLATYYVLDRIPAERWYQ
jgi:hypothetical protein